MVKFTNPYWSLVTKISYLQRRVLIYSIQYYYLNQSVVDDVIYERVSQQLLQLTEQATTKQLKQTQYYYCFYDYDGSTGFHLYDRLNNHDKKYLMRIAQHILRLSKS